MASSAQASSAQASSAQNIPIQEYIVQHPIIIDDVLTRFEIDTTPFLVALSEGHDIIIESVYSEIPIDDNTTIGKNVTDIIQLREFFTKHNIPHALDLAKGIFGVKVSFAIWLKDKPTPFYESIHEFMNQVSPQSHTVASFVALTLAYDNLELNIDNYTKRAYKYQDYALPPVRPITAVILSRGMIIPTIQATHTTQATRATQATRTTPTNSIFGGWQAISSPALSPAPSPAPMIASSPIPALMQIPEEISSGETTANPDEGYTQIQRKHRARVQYHPPSIEPLPKEYVGVGPPPLSVAVGSTYNGIKSQKGGILNFQTFWENGERGIDGVFVPEEERFRKYTRFALNFHKDFYKKELTPNDEIVQKYMKENLGPHYPAWAKLFLSA